MEKRVIIKMKEMNEKLRVAEGIKTLVIEILVEVISGVIAKLIAGGGRPQPLEESR